MTDPLSALLDTLNTEQRDAALYTGGPQLIIAGAGSGKTRVLMVKAVLYCTMHTVAPDQILCITFTNKAADEMKYRLGRFSLSVTARTFHATCLHILNHHGSYLGLKHPVIVYDEQDQLELVKTCMDELHYDRQSLSPGSVVEWISRRKDELLAPQPDASGIDKIKNTIYERYEAHLRANNALDFGDLIMRCVLLFKEYPSLCEHYRQKYTHLLVDEYQDTNTAQAVFLKLLAGDGHNLCVVGDPDQSIYGWRGANLNNILYFEHSFPDARIFKLERNYRSTDIILNATNKLIESNTNRRDKSLWTDLAGTHRIAAYYMSDDRSEARQIASLASEHCRTGIPYREMAVFYRTHAVSRLIEEIFMEYGIPYTVIGGLPFYQRKEIKDITCYLRIIANPADALAWRRALSVPRRGIGEKSMLRIANAAQDSHLTFYEALQQRHTIKGLTAKARTGIEQALRVVDEMNTAFASQPWDDALESLLEAIDYREYIEQNDLREQATARFDNIEALKDALREYRKEHPDHTVGDYLERIALRAGIDEWDHAQDRISLMSLHSAKGLEFDIVYLVGLEERLLPLIRDIERPEDIEEERRLCYVGMTRARKRLYLFSSTRRSGYGRDVFSKPSRFLSEIPADTIDVHDMGVSHASWNSGRYSRYDENAVASDTRYAAHIDEFGPGDKVYHYDLGAGTIMGGSGSGEKKKYIILFDGESQPCTVYASYAGLSKLD